MSILLEALRKSEKRRHAGEVPTIHGGDSPGEAPRSRRGAMLTWWLALPLAVVVTWWVTRSLPPAPPVAPSTPAQPESASPATQGRGATESESTDQSAAAPVRGTPAPVERLRSPVEELADGAVPERGGADSAAEGPARSDAPLGRPVPNDDPVAAPEVSATIVRGLDEVPLTPPDPAAAMKAPASPPAAAADDAGGSVIELSQLPRSLREELPPLNLTVLVFAREPADRFVMLDGRRRGEGDAVVPGLVVEEIRRDGAVLRYRLYRFLVRND